MSGVWLAAHQAWICSTASKWKQTHTTATGWASWGEKKPHPVISLSPLASWRMWSQIRPAERLCVLDYQGNAARHRQCGQIFLPHVLKSKSIAMLIWFERRWDNEVELLCVGVLSELQRGCLRSAFTRPHLRVPSAGGYFPTLWYSCLCHTFPNFPVNS